MATVTYGHHEPFEIPDSRTDLIAYYRGEGATVVTEEEKAALAAQAPAKSANKPAWVDYAVSQGAAREEAETLTKEQLVEQYGAE